MVQHEVWITPTLAAAALIQTAGEIDYDHDPRRRYIFPAIWRIWDPKSAGRPLFPDADRKRWERIREQSRILLKMLQAGGAGLLAGSDSGASNNFAFPGWTLHRELELMVESGLAPMQALQTATRNPARYLGELDRAGTVEAGKAADLVLLKASPLTEIRNIEEIDAVVLRGKLLERADLDRLLDDVANAAARTP